MPNLMSEMCDLFIYVCFITHKLIYLNSHPLEDVSRYRDPQPQVGEN